MIHVMPSRNEANTLRHGLTPSTMSRGLEDISYKGDAIYLFEDYDTMEDGLVNWMLEREEFEADQFFTVFEVVIPEGVEVHDDPEIAGSYYVTDPIPPDNIEKVERLDVGL